MPPDGRPPLHMTRTSSRAVLDRQESAHYDTVESPYLYGCACCGPLLREVPGNPSI